MRIAINGFGRIGRTFLRTMLEDAKACKEIEVVAINIGPAPINALAYAFKYDSVMGTFPADVCVTEQNNLVISRYLLPGSECEGASTYQYRHLGMMKDMGKQKQECDITIKVLAEKDPLNIDWKSLNVDWVVDASGRFTDRDGAYKHIQSGAGNVLITAPAIGEDATIIMGVNEEKYDKSSHKIISLGSCTTNALVPMLDVLHKNFGVESGFMTTVHAYTTTQHLLDGMDESLVRGRAAALNIVPTTTGATKVLGKVLPDLVNRIGGRALRVPVAKVSLVDLVINTRDIVQPTDINSAYKDVAGDSMQGILDITMELLVSSDFAGNGHSVVIDGNSTTVVADKTVQVLGWYDNEWGYCERIKDFLLYAKNR